jgi:hypothetical protein
MERRGSGAGLDEEDFDEFAAQLAEVRIGSGGSGSTTWRNVDRMAHLNIVALGCHGIGKSTLLGRIMYQLSPVHQRARDRGDFKATKMQVSKPVYKRVDLNEVAVKAQAEFSKTLPAGRVAAAVQAAVAQAKRAVTTSIPTVVDVHSGLASIVDRHQYVPNYLSDSHHHKWIHYYFVLNRYRYERIHQMTKDMKVSIDACVTTKYRLNFINIPGKLMLLLLLFAWILTHQATHQIGHVRYMPNAIKGISQADVAIVVIGPSNTIKPDEIEMEKAMLKYQLVAARVFGIKNLIVVVNKCEKWLRHDDVKVTKEVFETLKAPLITQLTSVGYKPAKLTFIPISALENVNIFSGAR